MPEASSKVKVQAHQTLIDSVSLVHVQDRFPLVLIMVQCFSLLFNKLVNARGTPLRYLSGADHPTLVVRTLTSFHLVLQIDRRRYNPTTDDRVR